MEYDVYHDESQEAGYWHGILLVPRTTRQVFLSHLEEIRKSTGYRELVRLKGLDRTAGPRYRCTRAWLHFGVAALMQNLKGKAFPFYTGKDGRNTEFAHLTSTIGARFIPSRVRDGHQQLTGYPDHAAKVETTFRMALKGGLHLFAGESKELTVSSFHFDGHEHHQRRLDPARIIGRLDSLRQQVTILDNASIFDDSGDHKRQVHQPYDDCQFLQLTDLLVSGFRTVLGHQTHEAQARVAFPLGELAKRWHEGYARMKNSRWFRGFCISECYLENDQWQFGDLRPQVPDMQLRLLTMH
jgi:hypothetical protein